MKDFDADRKERHAQREVDLGDRTFQLGGRTFTYKANVPYDFLKDIAAVNNSTEGDSVIETLERFCVDIIEDDPEGFLAVLRSREDPVTFADLNELTTWLMEQQVRRPTSAPSSSTDGRVTTGTDSTEVSSEQPAAA
jgi:hypothetical protein